jgi:hypothetical protein
LFCVIFINKVIMKKIKITKKQYETILEHEKNNRSLLKENNMLLGLSLLAGVKLTGQNEFLAKNSLSDTKVLNQIKNTLESDDKLKELVDQFKEKGMKNPEILLSDNANKIVDNYNNYSENDKLDFVAVKNLKELTGK